MKIQTSHGQSVTALFLEKGGVVWTIRDMAGHIVELCDCVILFGNEADAQTSCEEGEFPAMLNLLEL